jgi:PAS domain S-box-containing protein
MKILAIDDNNDNLVTLKALLNEAFPDAIVILASSGFEGIEKALAEKPDVILMDLVMPLMDGIETCRKLKEDRFLKRIPVLMVTAYLTDSKIRSNALESGIEAFLSKPIDPSELTAQITSMIRIRESENQVLQANEQLEERVKMRTQELLLELESRNRLEAELKESEERYRALFDRSLDSVYILDFKGRFIDANNAALNLFGFKRENIRSFNFASLISQDQSELLNKTIAEICKKGFQQELTEFNLSLGNGANIIIETQGSAILSHGKYIAIQLIARNITERTKMKFGLEEAKDKAEAGDRLKTAFIQNISHEIRTPLNGILGFSSLMMQPELTLEEKTEYFSHIKTSSNRLLNTINNFMDISMISSGTIEKNLQYFSPVNSLENIYENYQSISIENQLTLTLELPKDTNNIFICSDYDLFQKIFSHLLDNALKFTAKGEVTFGFIRKRSFLKFFVKDTGSGISRDAQKKIYDYFFQEEASNTRGYQGSGLGLSIAKGLIELLGSETMLDSDIGEETTFSFNLPYEIINDFGKSPFIQPDWQLHKNTGLKVLKKPYR